MGKASPFVRPLVRELHAYVPGEQPKIKGLVKLNTNENPYPPSPKVLRAVRSATDERLRLYPPPSADILRAKLAKLHRCDIENIIVGNGSDELLAMIPRAFVEPLPESADAGGSISSLSRSTVQYFDPSYSLYPVLAAIHGAGVNPVPLLPDFGIPSVKQLKAGGQWDFQAALSIVTTPNAPSGRAYTPDELESLCRAQRGLVVLDEAYVDFGAQSAMKLALTLPNVLVAHTFSKGYSLCYMRVGYGVGHPDLIAALHKIRDSYNVNGLGQIAASATLDDIAYYRKNFRRVIATRDAFAAQLQTRGFEVFPSKTNFLLVRPPKMQAEQWLEALRGHKILVRWFRQPEVCPYLRISIGTDAEMRKCLAAIDRILKTLT